MIVVVVVVVVLTMPAIVELVSEAWSGLTLSLVLIFLWAAKQADRQKIQNTQVPFPRSLGLGIYASLVGPVGTFVLGASDSDK